ncbi:MAG TPA: hypothetical protein PKO21_04810 [Verrucomicrobiota bacterium]|nr:hypothetical protein [Verrucomicrobiota bacterium]
MKLFSPDSAHWYQRDGVPLHTVPSLKGSLQTATMRPTTLRDARKLGLLPSVTNILGVIAKPELTAWLQEQAVMAALTLPRNPGESEDDFARRVVADSQTTRDSAADFGTAFHAGAERIAHTLEVDRADLHSAWLNKYRDWYQANALVLRWTEKVLVHPEWGYAGTADLLIEHPVHGLTLVDLKTMKFPQRGGKVPGGPPGTTGGSPVPPKPYKSWCYQLAAYRRALGEPVRCMNLIVNSVEPSAPIEHVWTEDEMETGWRAFVAAHRLWVIEKGYDPAAKASAEMVLTA